MKGIEMTMKDRKRIGYLCGCLVAAISLASSSGRAADANEPLYTQKGEDQPFEELMRKEALPKGVNSTKGVTGSTIEVNKKLVESAPEARRPIPEDIKIHTVGNSSIPRKDFSKWSRWYQEDGSTQVFRLFKGETNVRNEREFGCARRSIWRAALDAWRLA